MFEDDIRMCKAEDRPLKEKCRRYSAEELKLLQSYFSETQYKDEKYSVC